MLKRNPNYWGGEGYLDGLKFVLLAGASAYLDGLKTGSIDAAHLREPAVVAHSKGDGLGGIETIFSLGEILLVNNGVEVTCAKEQPAKVKELAERWKKEFDEYAAQAKKDAPPELPEK